MDLLDGAAPPLKKIAPPPPEIAPADACACGSTEWWVGTPSICKKCRQPARPVRPPPEPEPAQNSLPGFPSDPVPHSPVTPPEQAEAQHLDLAEALRRLRDFLPSAPPHIASSIDAVLARLAAEIPAEPAAAAPADDVQAPLFALGETPPGPTAATAEPIRVYVHFENFGDLREFGRLIGCSGMSGATRQLRYSRDRVDPSYAPPADQPERERDRTFADVQVGLFGSEEWWEHLWKGMPSFDQKDVSPVYSVEMLFDSWDDVDHLEQRVEQTIPRGPRRTPSIWYPEAEIGRIAGRRWISSAPRVPAHPVYIVSKGRWESRLTSKSLTRLGVPHFIVVEAQEVERYAEVCGPLATILTLDRQYQLDYDACDDLGMTKGKGPGPARNFAWDHAIASGARWHWVMDDNIEGFYRLTNNLKLNVGDGTIFRAMEDWCDRYSNVSMAGPNYFMFASRKTRMPPLVLNTRIYSCNLIRNDAPYRWRGRYNEDTDISLRMLKDGLVTAQFNAFLQLKLTTQTLGGGNTAEFYAKEGTRPKSEMQVKLHPDVSKIVFKWGRWHHHVDYRPFRKNQPALRAGVVLPDGREDYGMGLVEDERRDAA